MEEKRRAQERKHEMEMQLMMFSFLQQIQYANQEYIIHRCMEMGHPIMQCLLATHLTSCHIRVHLVITYMMMVIISTTFVNTLCI